MIFLWSEYYKSVKVGFHGFYFCLFFLSGYFMLRSYKFLCYVLSWVWIHVSFIHSIRHDSILWSRIHRFHSHTLKCFPLNWNEWCFDIAHISWIMHHIRSNHHHYDIFEEETKARRTYSFCVGRLIMLKNYVKQVHLGIYDTWMRCVCTTFHVPSINQCLQNRCVFLNNGL